MANLDYTHEATTVIRFPSDHNFTNFREAVYDRYDPRMVKINRLRVFRDGVDAEVHHSRGLGAELRGLAYGSFEGHTINTIYEKEN